MYNYTLKKPKTMKHKFKMLGNPKIKTLIFYEMQNIILGAQYTTSILLFSLQKTVTLGS